jgi:hypothetical protein
MQCVCQQDVENSEKLAAEWVSQDVLDYERGVTAELESKIKELNKAVFVMLLLLQSDSIVRTESVVNFWLLAGGNATVHRGQHPTNAGRADGGHRDDGRRYNC